MSRVDQKTPIMESRPRIRDLGYKPGKFSPGPSNSILDVEGVKVGQVTIHKEPGIHTGVTIIFPREIDETPLKPCYAATHDLNGVGELTGCHSLGEWGFLSNPIAITNTISVGKVYDGLFLWSLEEARRRGEDDLEAIRRFSIPIVGETYDGLLNDICASVIDRDVVNEAIAAASTQTEVREGNHGGGTGMICHGFKGGTGTSSRIVPGIERSFSVGILVQANYGKKEDLRIGNVPIGALLIEEDKLKPNTAQSLPAGGKAVEGSIIVIVATDAPLLPHQLRRIAQHAGIGVAQVGGHAAGRNFSGEIFLAFSTGTSPNELAQASNGFAYLPPLETQPVETLKNETIDSLFYAVSEATEEAILNAMCKAESLTGYKGRHVEALPVDRVRTFLDKHLILGRQLRTETKL